MKSTFEVTTLTIWSCHIAPNPLRSDKHREAAHHLEMAQYRMKEVLRCDGAKCQQAYDISFKRDKKVIFTQYLIGK
jgi:hypothetical protein